MLNLNGFVHVFFSLKLAQLESQVLAYKNVCFNSKNKYSIPSLTNQTFSCEGPFNHKHLSGVLHCLYKKNFIANIFRVSPFRPQKFQGLHFDMKIMGQPHRKSY